MAELIMADIAIEGVDGLLWNYHPRMITLGDGRFAVVWIGEQVYGSSGTVKDIFVQRFEADGTLLGDLTQLRGMTGEKLFGYWGGRRETWPATAAVADGGFVVAWSEKTTDGQNDDIFIQRFDDVGDLTGDMIRLQGMDGKHNDSSVSISALNNGGFVAAWSGLCCTNRLLTVLPLSLGRLIPRPL